MKNMQRRLVDYIGDDYAEEYEKSYGSKSE